MNMIRSFHAILTATLTSLVILGVPDGHAEIQSSLSAGLAMPQTHMSAPFEPASTTPATPPRTHAMALMGESPLPPVPEKTKQRFFQADAGGSATCGVLQGSRRILCWGRNDLGQASPPVGKYRYVAMGENHGCSLTIQGGLRCWGVTSAYPTPEQAKGRFLSVATGEDHTCAVRANHKLACWGNNDNGELNVPPGKFRQVVARGDHSCGITRDKRLLCWGEKAFTDYAQSISVPVKKVATGQLHACALGVDGLAKCWGNGIHGENQAPGDRFVDIVAGDWHTCGLRADRTAVCWGRDQYGQTQVGMDKYRMIAGGGMQTCGILRGNRHLACHGSFANNEVWYPQDNLARTRASQADGLARPQLAFLTILQGVSGVLNSSIVNGGKMLDGKMGKWEKTAWGTQVVSLFANMFMGFFGSKPENPNTEMFNTLKDLQVDIKKIEKGVDEMQVQLARTQLTTLQSWCDQQLNEYDTAYKLLEGEAYGKNESTTGARKAYLQLLKAQEAVLTQSIDQQRMVAYPTEELQKFRDHYLPAFKSARSNLAIGLIGASADTGAFSACFEKSHADYKMLYSTVPASGGENKETEAAKTAYPFDDRALYDHTYQLLRGALLMQGEILTMQQDVEMQLAYQKLTEPRADAAPPINFNPEEHGLGFCRYADERKVSSHAEYSPRWGEVAAICQANRDRIQTAYKDMVEQVEFVGGAYSDDQVVLSLTSEQMGLPKVSGERNWLWLRNIPNEDWFIPFSLTHGTVTGKWGDYQQQSDTSPFLRLPPVDQTSDAGLYYRNQGARNAVYQDDEKFGESVWHSNGQAWQDIHAFRVARRKANSIESVYEDLITRMTELEDMQTEACARKADGQCEMTETSSGKYVNVDGPRLPLFTGLGQKPFWMSGESFTYNARSNLSVPKDYVNEKTQETIGLKCFLAEQINYPQHHYSKGVYRLQDKFGSSNWDDWLWYKGDTRFLHLSGRVCNTDEMGATMKIENNYLNIPVVQVKDCDGHDYFSNSGNARKATFCAGYGYSTKPDPKYIYYDALGWMVVKAREITVPFGSDYFVVDKYLDKYKPYADGNLYHMPVVDIGQRQCKYKMVGTGRRQPYRNAGGVRIASLCGEDLDKLIREVVPRPEFPPVPESMVRLPEVN